MYSEDILQVLERISYIIICYSIDSRKSYNDLTDWVKGINSNAKGKDTPIALVATKKDLSRSRRVPEKLGKLFMKIVNEEAKDN